MKTIPLLQPLTVSYLRRYLLLWFNNKHIPTALFLTRFPMEEFPLLDELMEVAGSHRLHDRMGLWFMQEDAEEGAFAKIIHATIDYLKRMIFKRT